MKGEDLPDRATFHTLKVEFFHAPIYGVFIRYTIKCLLNPYPANVENRVSS